MNIAEKLFSVLMGKVSKLSSGMETINETITTTTSDLTALEGKVDTGLSSINDKVDNMIIESGTSDAETIASRTDSVTGKTYSTLGNRLDTQFGEIKEDLSDIDERVKVIEDGGGSGLTDSQKLAILNCFQHVAWTDNQGQTYYDELEDVLFPPAELRRITAVYSNVGDVYPDTSLDDLKPYITVTAHYSDRTNETVNAYTLSGTLEVGTSTVTISYSGKRTTINVVVVDKPKSDMTQWSDGVAYTDIEVISDSYYNASGNITPYPGWSRTGKVPIHGAVSVTFEGHGTGNAGVAGIYCWWFKEDGTPLSNFGDGLKAYEPTTKQVPSEAYYFGISGTNAQINGVVLNGITPYGA